MSLRAALRDRVGRARRQVLADLAADPALRYILLLSAALALFWIWHRVPNFATRDERWRVVDPIEVVAFAVDDPSLSAVKEGLAHWRAYGATFYLYGLTALPIVALAALRGQLDSFAALRGAGKAGLFTHWQALPGWVWSSAIVSARVVNAMLAVGCVYLVYRIATRLRDRATGRIAALLLSLTWALIVLAHEAGEDVPALFCLLLAFYLAIRYLESGDESDALWGAAITGLAMSFKLTAGLGIVFFAVAHGLRARRSGAGLEAFYRPTLFKRAVAVGALIFFLCFPSIFAEGPLVVLRRAGRGLSAKSTGHGWLSRPTWWWLLRGYLNAFGWPLFVASVGGVLASLTRLDERSLETDGVLMALSGLAVALGVFSLWAYLRTHHLLPTIALLVILLAIALRRLIERWQVVGRVVLAGLLVSTAIYTGIGTLGYASQPRDQAVAYMSDHADSNPTVETYPWDPQEAAVPYDFRIYRWSNRSEPGEWPDRTVAEWMRDMPRRCPDFIVLNHQRSLLYLASNNHSALARDYDSAAIEAYLRDLLYTDRYPYEVARRFGPTPVFLKTGHPRDSLWNLLQAGWNPRSIQYGDPQDFGVDQYAIVLERTGNCTVSRPTA